jgi:UDP-glucose 4-epimerase
MRVLVTGGLGFVGRAVALDLVAAGHDVDVLSRGGSGAEPPAGAGLVEGDVRDRARLTEVVARRRYGGVVHLAALTRARDSTADPLSYFDVNLGGTLNLLSAIGAAEPAGPTRFVLASSSVVYGSTRTGALGEELTPRPENPYAASKFAAEQLVTAHAATGAVSAVVLRCFNVAGAVDGHADADPTRLIPNVLRAARGELPHVTVSGDGSAVREYTHVCDVAAAFRLAVEAERVGDVYNVGTGRGVAVRDVIAVAERVTGRPVPVEHLPPRPEPHTLISDPRRLNEQLGWRAVHSELDDIIRSAWDASAWDAGPEARGRMFGARRGTVRPARRSSARSSRR